MSQCIYMYNYFRRVVRHIANVYRKKPITWPTHTYDIIMLPILYKTSVKNVIIWLSGRAHDVFLELPSSGTLKVKRLESQAIWFFGSSKTIGPTCTSCVLEFLINFAFNLYKIVIACHEKENKYYFIVLLISLFFYRTCLKQC